MSKQKNVKELTDFIEGLYVEHLETGRYKDIPEVVVKVIKECSAAKKFKVSEIIKIIEETFE